MIFLLRDANSHSGMPHPDVSTVFLAATFVLARVATSVPTAVEVARDPLVVAQESFQAGRMSDAAEQFEVLLDGGAASLRPEQRKMARYFLGAAYMAMPDTALGHFRQIGTSDRLGEPLVIAAHFGHYAGKICRSLISHAQAHKPPFSPDSANATAL